MPAQMINLSRRWWMSWSRSPKSCSIARRMQMNCCPMASCPLMPRPFAGRCSCGWSKLSCSKFLSGDKFYRRYGWGFTSTGSAEGRTSEPLSSRCCWLESCLCKPYQNWPETTTDLRQSTGNSELSFLAGKNHDFLQSAVRFPLNIHVETSRKNLTGSVTYSQPLQKVQQQAIPDNCSGPIGARDLVRLIHHNMGI